MQEQVSRHDEQSVLQHTFEIFSCVHMLTDGRSQAAGAMALSAALSCDGDNT